MAILQVMTYPFVVRSIAFLLYTQLLIRAKLWPEYIGRGGGIYLFIYMLAGN
jgi:hypothetical protein